MKKKVKKKDIVLSIILSLVVIVAILLVVIGFLKEEVQLSPSAQTNVRLQIGNAAPSIISINPVPNIDLVPAPAPSTNVIVTFTARDPNGAADLNDASAAVSFTSTGEPARASASCTRTGQAGKERTYECNIPMQYYDKSGLWDLGASINDTSGASDQRTSQFTVNLLRDISIGPATIGFPTVTQGGINIVSSENTLITNNGNAQVPSNSLEITAFDLLGETNPAEIIPAANFRAADRSETNVCANGNPLIHNAPVTITAAALPRGPSGTNTGEFTYCIQSVPDNISAQFYSTSATGGQPWTITLN